MYEIVIILLLILLNGFLAMSEIAFVSARRFKLEEKAKRGSESAKKALALLNEPDKFLSAVQIGITLVGILAGAFGGFAMAEDLVPYVNQIEFFRPYSAEISLGIIVTLITYLSLVIGELVPKSIALNNPEKITLLVAGMMHLISKVFSPVVWLLSISTRFVLFFLPGKKSEDPLVSEDELKSLLEFGKIHGAFENEETEMIKKIISFNDKKVVDIMIPRRDIEWIDLALTNQEIFNFFKNHHFSRYIVCKDDIDHTVGLLESKEFLLSYNSNPEFDLQSILSEILFVPTSIYSIDLFDKFRGHKTNIALVVNEYGGTEGLVTLHDLIENIVGDIPEKFDKPEPKIFEREDKSFLIDGSVEIDKLSEILHIEFPAENYRTLAGFLIKHIGEIPDVGDSAIYRNYKFEVVDMDQKRVDKVLVQKIDTKSKS